MWNWRVIFPISLILLGSGFSSQAMIQPIQQPVRIFTEHLPPFQVVNGANVTGIATEIVKRTFEHAGIPYQIEPYTWTRAYQLALRLPHACIYSISFSQTRKPFFQWIGAIASTTTAIYSLDSRNDIQLRQLKDAKNYVIAVTEDDITHHYLLKNGFKEGKQLYLLENVSLMLNVLHGRQGIDLVVVNDTILKYRAAESGVPLTSLKKQLDLPELPLDFHLACSISTDDAIVRKLQTSLAWLKTQPNFPVLN